MEKRTQKRSEAAQKAAEVEDAYKKGEEKVKELEKDPPKNLEGLAQRSRKVRHVRRARGRALLRGGPRVQARPVRPEGHNRDGSVEIDGEEVDDPSKYKGDPIPGGPTDDGLGASDEA